MSDDGHSDRWSDRRTDGRVDADDGIMFLDDASVELIEEPSLDTAITRVWTSPYRVR